MLYLCSTSVKTLRLSSSIDVYIQYYWLQEILKIETRLFI